MKKLISSIFLSATFAVCANTTEPFDKLPAIIIDTMYVSSESLVIEYEILRPFDQVGLSVHSSRSMESRDDKPVFLSGNVGKGRTSIPISLNSNQVTHFNVFLTGGQFVNKSDTADYHPNGYDYAIFRKQIDRTVQQFRTRYTEEEKTLMDEQIRNSAFVRRSGQFDNLTVAIDVSDSTISLVNERFANQQTQYES